MFSFVKALTWACVNLSKLSKFLKWNHLQITAHLSRIQQEISTEKLLYCVAVLSSRLLLQLVSVCVWAKYNSTNWSTHLLHVIFLACHSFWNLTCHDPCHVASLIQIPLRDSEIWAGQKQWSVSPSSLLTSHRPAHKLTWFSPSCTLSGRLKQHHHHPPPTSAAVNCVCLFYYSQSFVSASIIFTSLIISQTIFCLLTASAAITPPARF